MNQTVTSLEGILLEAVEITSPGERQVYLERVCAGNEDLRAKLERLMANYFRAGSFLEHPVAVLEATTLPVQVEVPGTQIGPYKLIEQIGEGGMGVVHVAEQHHPVRRTVALKLIKPGMDSKQVIARFEAERQALALMDHPNIAKVLDAGTTEAGRPYFVMELVRGIPITEYCDQARLTVRQRLEVFVHVCRAVQHAHTKGVIHRDLKPSNVLVTSHDGVPVPLVIDFGVAKALGNELTEKTLHTGFAQMIGTPLYMSPEQAEFNLLGVDTRSDIYSLGVLLYELLTGVTPFDGLRLRTVNHDEFRRILREEEPPRPSNQLSTLGASLSTVSERRGVDPRKLTQTLHGELDWIVMKCLEKDRTRRYETASALAADLQRFLNNEAVEACPPSAVYQLRKFTRRHRGALSVTAGILALVLVVAGSLGWALRDRAARQNDAERRAGDALQNAEAFLEQENWPEGVRAVEQAEGFLEGGVAEAPILNRARQLGRELKMAQRLEEMRLRRDANKEEQYVGKDRDADYAAAFKEYGLDVDAFAPQVVADQIVARPIRRQLVAALEDWAHQQIKLRTEGGKQRLAVARAVDPDPWRNRLRDLVETNDIRAREELIATAPIGDWPMQTLLLLGRMTESTPSERVLALLLKEQQRHPDDFWLNDVLATNLRNIRPPRREEALRFMSIAVALRPQNSNTHNNFGSTLYENGRFDEAMAEFREAIRLHKDNILAHNNVGSVLMNQKGLVDEAITEFREAVRLDNNYATAHFNLGNALKSKGLLDDAIAEYREAIRLKKDHAFAHNALGNSLRIKGKMEEAITELREAIRLNRDSPYAYYNLGLALHSQRHFAEALSNFRRSHELGSKMKGWSNPSADWVKRTERLVEIDGKFPTILSGQYPPANADEQADYAEYFQLKHHYAAAARYFREAFAVKPDLVMHSIRSPRYDAACCAALASGGAGQDAAKLTDADRAGLRKQALDWLRAELTRQSQVLEKGPAKDIPTLAKSMRHWLQDADLAAVRDESSLSRLPMDEKQAWSMFWAEVRETLRKANQKPATENKSR